MDFYFKLLFCQTARKKAKRREFYINGDFWSAVEEMQYK
jgi:hypothetical protein